MKRVIYILIISLVSLLYFSCALGDGGSSSRFVAVGNSGQAWWSTDGSAGSWNNSSPDPGGNNLWGITYGNGRFVAVGNSGQAWWSLDGSLGSWTDSSPDLGGIMLYGIAYKP